VDKITSADQILFRASSVGKLITSTGKLGDTAKTNLIETYTEQVEGRRNEFSNIYTDKGNAVQSDSIQLLRDVTGQNIRENRSKIRLKNEFISGEIDAFVGERLDKAIAVYDTKSSYDRVTFNKTRFSKAKKDEEQFNNDYKWQGISYMWLTGAEDFFLSYCLVNNTAEGILSLKEKLKWQIKEMDYSVSEDYKQKAKQIEINHIFDLGLFMDTYPFFEFDNDISEWHYDIPANDRVFIQNIKWKEEDKFTIINAVTNGRKWLQDNVFERK